MDIQVTIENLYQVFSNYTARNMEHCDCGCIDSEDVKKLASKELRKLTEDDFASYHGSAMYTWGEIEHYKHFLPRILEVHSKKNGKGLIGLEEIILKLEHAKWKSWNKTEVNAIKEFILSDWGNFINNSVAELDKEKLESYLFFLPLQELISIWDIDKTDNSLKNFIWFMYYHGSEILNHQFKLLGKTHYNEFNNLINSKSLIAQLENEFFNSASVNEQFAEKVSAVIQMIEQHHITNKS